MASMVVKDDFKFSTPPNTSFGQTSVLVRAITAENVRRTKFLLKNGCSPNKSVGETRIQALIAACYVKNATKRYAIFEALFRYGVNPELTDAFGRNAIMYTCALNLEDELCFILDNFICSFYNHDCYGNTLLHICARYSTGSITQKIATKMVSYSMNINIPNSSNHTPLDEAILHRNIDSVHKLYELNARSTLPEFPQYIYKSVLGIDARNIITVNTLTQRRQSQQPLKILPSTLKPIQIQRRMTQIEFSKKSLSMGKCASEGILPKSTRTPSRASTFSTEIIPKPIGPPINQDDMLYKLLDLQSRRGMHYTRRQKSAQVPIDDKWRATIQKYSVIEPEVKQQSQKRRDYIMSRQNTPTDIKSVERRRPDMSYKPIWKKISSLIVKNKVTPIAM